MLTCVVVLTSCSSYMQPTETWHRHYRVDANNDMPQGKESGDCHGSELVKTLKLICIIHSFNTR
jgi:hypothetical protein